MIAPDSVPICDVSHAERVIAGSRMKLGFILVHVGPMPQHLPDSCFHYELRINRKHNGFTTKANNHHCG